MQIDNIDEIEKFVEEMNYFFTNIERVNSDLKNQLRTKELEQDDLLHEIELSKLSIGERSRTYSHLEKVLQERRIIKDKIDLINTIKPYTNKFIMKGIFAETDITIKNIETLRNNQETRQYTPRVLKDLKCAKKKGE